LEKQMRIRRTIRATVTASLALGALALMPALAHADSIVYIKDNNVWLAAPDGSKQTQVTSDGTADSPYRAPSQADNGTIAVSHNTNIVVLEQNGEVVRTLDPPPLVDSTSHQVDGVPVYVRISPDATKIAYGFASYSCPVGTDCAARASTSVTDADRVVPPSTYGQVVYGDPQWVSGSRLMVFGGYLYQVNLWDLGQADRFHWFDDQDWAGHGNSTDLGDGDLSADGRLWVGIRGYDSDVDNRYRQLIWFNATRNPATDAPPPVPTALCLTNQEKGTAGPTIAPSGDAFAFEQPDGVHVARGISREPDRCAEAQFSMLLPGASQPDWGRADVAPKPRGTGGNGGDGGDGGNGGDTGKKASLSVTKTKLGTACRTGLKVRLKGAPAGKVAIVVRKGKKTVGKRTVNVGQTGAGTFAVKFSKAGAKNVCKGKARSVKLVVSAAGAKKTVTVKG
jgi:hypothetical protein